MGVPERWIPTDNNNQITQNIKIYWSSREIENIFENSDFIYMLNQASGDRQILAKQLNISPTQLSYVTNSNEGKDFCSMEMSLSHRMNRFRRIPSIKS